VAPRLTGLTKLTLETAPSVCHECIWWQTGGRREVDKDRWIEKVEDEFGAFGTVYYDSDGRVLGSMQYGPAAAFPRATELPAGPASEDAILVTCAYLVASSSPWVLQSLFLAAIGEARERGAKAVEAFAYRYPEGESAYERFHVHKTIFPALVGPRRPRAARARRPRPCGGDGAREGAPPCEAGAAARARPRAAALDPAHAAAAREPSSMSSAI
jgi:hypothetical protein